MTRDYNSRRAILGEAAWMLATVWHAGVAVVDRVLACAPWRWGQ